MRDVLGSNIGEEGDEDLADLAAMQTLLNSGTAFAVEPVSAWPWTGGRPVPL